jgi:hypothetical protein
MDCTIRFNSEGSIKNVLTPEGKESRLFKSIAKLPHVDSLEEALELFKNAYSDAVQKGATEPKLVFKSDRGVSTKSYKEALAGSSGGDIKVGLESEEKGFVSILEVSSNINPSTRGGFINNMISEGIMSDERLIQDGKSYHKAAGFDQKLQLANELIIYTEALENLGKSGINITKDGRIELSEKIKTVKVNGIDLSIDEIRSSSYRELVGKVGEADALSLAINNATKSVIDSRIETEKLTVKDKDLKLKLLDLLKKMNVSTMTINDYVKKYTDKNGVEPSAAALVDIANQVVAFKDGVINLEDLAEETVHFVVETWDQVEIENLVRNAHKTDAYREFSEIYREIYTRENPNMTEAEVENLVRREILGKELAKSLKENFNLEEKTEIQKSILQNLFDKFIEFFRTLTIQDNFYKDLANLSTKVQDLVLTQDISKYLDLNQAATKKFRMYNQNSGDPAIDTKSVVANQLVQTLLEQEKNLRITGRGSAAQIQRLNALTKKALTASSALEILKLAKRQARYIEESIIAANKKGRTLNNEESIVFEGLKEYVTPLLERFKVIIKEDPELSNLYPDVEKVLSEIGWVKGKVLDTENQILENIIDRIIVRENLPDTIMEDGREVNVRSRLLNSISSATKDTNYLYALYGQLTHASDPLLGALGSVISDMSVIASQNFNTRAKTFQKRIRELGFNEKDLSSFYDKDGYILSMYDWSRFEEDITLIKAEEYKNITGNASSIEELKTMVKTGTLPEITDSVQAQEYQNSVTKKTNEKIERSFTEEFYEQREKRYTDLNISEATKIELRLLGIDLGQIIARSKTEDGKVKYSFQDKYDLDGYNLKRKRLKSLYDEFGELKAGIEVLDYETADSIEVNGQYYSLIPGTPNEEAIVAMDINKLDKKVLEEKKAEALKSGFNIDTEKLSSTFLKELEKIEDGGNREEALEFFLMNTTIGFSNNFWSGFDNSTSFASVIDRAEKDSNTEADTLMNISTFKRYSGQRKAILKQYQDSRNYTNTMAEEMPDNVKLEVVRLSEDIDRLYNSLYSKFKDALPERTDTEEPVTFESKPNQAYYEALDDEKITGDKDKEYDFILKHVTKDNKQKIASFSEAINLLKRGRFLTESQRFMIENVTGFSLEEILPEELEDIKLDYAKKKLVPYYRAFSPKGIEEFYDKLKNSDENVFDIVKELNDNENVKLSNNFSYYEVGEVKFKNKNYVDSFEGGMKQPKLTQYLNQKFVDTFDPIVDSENNPILKDGEIQVTKNQKMYDLYKEYISFQKDTMKSYKEENMQNIYLAPQVTRTGMERAEKFLKDENKSKVLKDVWKDITQYRVDEQVFGEEVDGESLIKKSGFRVIPKYFLKKLEDSSFVSTDLFYSSMLMAQQAELYKARREKYSEFAALHDKVLNRNYPNGKSASSTNTYKMFKSFLDSNLFGVVESRQWRVDLPVIGQVDMSKVITFIHNWVKNTSLALSPIIPFTSWLTAESQILMERYIGQYVDKNSMKKANNELRKSSTAAIKENLDVNSTSRLSLLGEWFGAFDLKNRYENSKYNKGVRFLGKAGYAMHTAGNFLPISRVMLSALYGNRVYKGKVVDFNVFSRMHKLDNKSASVKDIENAWEALSDKAIYNYLQTDSGTVMYNYDQLATDMGRVNDDQFKEDFKNIEFGLMSKIKKIVERVDGQIKEEERTLLQRDVLGRFTMTHKGWMSISLSNRLKNRHISFATGEVEEGSYRTIARVLKESINKGVSQKSFKAGIKNAWEAYTGAQTELERTNIRRTLIEFSFLQALFLVSLALGKWADDDKDEGLVGWTAQMSAYLAERTASETSSSQFGVSGEIYKTIKEPLVGLNKIENGVKVWTVFDFDTVKTGRYTGLTNSQTYLIKNVVGLKAFYDLYSAKNLRSLRDTYDFFDEQEKFTLISTIVDEEDLENE